MITLVCLLCGIFNLSEAAFDSKFATYAIWHSQSTYCDPDSYITRASKHILEGFVPVHAIKDEKHDTNGYIGYTESQHTIYVAFRGTESIQNFITDASVEHVPYPLCSECKVHKGFFEAEQHVIGDIITEVKSLKQQFPSYSVLVTGHSLGGALATLAAMDIHEAGLSPVRLFNFGSPRVGDREFAVFYSSHLKDHVRVTHHKDIVPHIPVHEEDYLHINGEWYQPGDWLSNSTMSLVDCTGYEDPDCSYQWTLTSVEDHMSYLGVDLGTHNCDDIL